jgi:prevent-host-death family protein
METVMGIPDYDMNTASKMIHAFVPVSRFNKGEAGKIIEEVKQEGVRVIIKNNAPECVMITVEEYDRLMKLADMTVRMTQSKEEEERRQEFIKKIRKNVKPVLPHSKDRVEVMNRIGQINIDEEAVNELRRISVL